MNEVAVALGHIRNAVWQLLRLDGAGALALALEALELEALLSLHDIEPDVVPLASSPAASLLAARDVMEGVPQMVPPAAWAAVQSLLQRLA